MGLKAMEPYSTYYGAGYDLLTDEAMDSWMDSLSRGKPHRHDDQRHTSRMDRRGR